MSVNANEEMLAGYADRDAGYPDVDPDAINLHTGYADTDADVCISIMSLCCIKFRSCIKTPLENRLM